MALRIIAAVFCIAIMTACSGGNSVSPALPSGGAPSRANNAPQTSSAISQCADGFFGDDIAISEEQPHDAFVAAKSVVKHFASIAPGSGPCNLGPELPDVQLGGQTSWGVTLDKCGNLYVTAGASEFAISKILKIAPPYSGTPTVFYSGGTNFRSLGVSTNCNILYAADFGAGKILRFDLSVGPQSVTTFATIPGVFGIDVAGADDVFVTSNGGFTGCASGVGTDDVKHVTAAGVNTIATGLALPEGIGGDGQNLYIAAGSVVYTVPVTGGTPRFYAGSPILFSHGVTIGQGAGYVTDSNGTGHLFKFPLL